MIKSFDELTEDERAERIETEKIECLLGLGGGELESEPWERDDEDPVHDDEPVVAAADRWYEGVPDGCEIDPYAWEACPVCAGTGTLTAHGKNAECPICEGSARLWFEYRTVISHRQPSTPDGWEFVIQNGRRSECECWRCRPGTDWDGSDEQVLAAHHDANTCTDYRGDPNCPLCEGDGHIYFGSDAPSEFVYRRIQ